MSQSTDNFSIYIPTLRKKYNVEYISYVFWHCGLGSVDRIDFVPIMKPKQDSIDLEKGEPSDLVEDTKFRQAFLYVRPDTKWTRKLVQPIEQDGSFRFYPYRRDYACGDENEYWLIRKNINPIPYATTELNVHQLVNNNALLEARVAELEAKNKEFEECLLALTEEKLRQIKQNLDADISDDEESKLDETVYDDSYKLPDAIPDDTYVIKTCRSCNKNERMLSSVIHCSDCSDIVFMNHGLYNTPREVKNPLDERCM
jgi:hypothetical protein